MLCENECGMEKEYFKREYLHYQNTSVTFLYFGSLLPCKTHHPGDQLYFVDTTVVWQSEIKDVHVLKRQANV